jgi:hypothetical protein
MPCRYRIESARWHLSLGRKQVVLIQSGYGVVMLVTSSEKKEKEEEKNGIFKVSKAEEAQPGTP